ncbi:hypothetical protein BKA70DRAFT_1492558 [Coprinopsis sp. MPI-PUGE-AT-0042]|nr:hypothetical protein BKA70DRAFT_1492558 [Coprinopsis sp. MPI-PUGE-AT-0042]
MFGVIGHHSPAGIRDRTERERPQASQTPVAHPPHTSSHSATAAHRGERSPRVSTPSTSKPSLTSPRRHAVPQVVVSRHSADADAEDFSWRLHISSRASPCPAPSQASKTGIHKLHNPDSDRMHIRRAAEPEAASDTTGSSYVPTPRPHREERGAGGARQLFDFCKDDPVRFSVLARPPSTSSLNRPSPAHPSKPFADYVSASSTSSKNASQTSSVFTLPSTTSGSSASSHIFDGRPKEDESGNNIFGKQLKRLYRTITELEARVQQEDGNDEDEGMTGRGVVLKGKEAANADADKEKWKKLICDHKELAETIHNLLEISLSPSVPASPRTIPVKYNIVVRLWTYAFLKVLESLRRTSFQSPVALEHLQDFIYYAYTSYTGLLEEPTLNVFKFSWLEALGDLARYRMGVAAVVNSSMGGQGSYDAGHDDNESVSDSPAARIDDSPSPSVGIVAARSMELEPEKERWRNIVREWYGAGLAEQLGTGKLHYHLGLLSREVEAKELRGIYHFTKSMTTLHPFSTSCENVLPVWSSAAQARRWLLAARASELFVLLHGILFTNIQLGDFQPSLARFIERLNIEGAEEKEWIMMGTDANVAQAAAMRVMAKKVAAGVPGAVVPQEDRMEVDGDEQATRPELPPALSLALQLTFTLLSHPHRQASAFARPSLNPYLTVILTFLATILKQALAVEVLERSVPWQDLAIFFATTPCQNDGRCSRVELLPALPEDWCMCGMEWVGRKVFEHGYWKSGEDRKAELDVLEQSEGLELADGRIEGNEDEDADGSSTKKSSDLSELERRWTRVCRSAMGIAQAVNGLACVEGTMEWKLKDRLAQKVEQWREEDRVRELEDKKCAWTNAGSTTRWRSTMKGYLGRAMTTRTTLTRLKALEPRRRYLGFLLKLAKNNAAAAASPARSRPRSKKAVDNCPKLSIAAGSGVLVADTNTLLLSFFMLSPLVESMNLLKLPPTPSTMSHPAFDHTPSRVQTSKGNYLTSLNVQTKEVDFSSGAANADRSMGDLILKAAIWQEEYWVDRSSMLKVDSVEATKTAEKFVFLSLDRNLCLKARSRQLAATGEKDLAVLLLATKETCKPVQLLCFPPP